MNYEVWLRTNRRALSMVALLPLIALVGCAIWFGMASHPVFVWMSGSGIGASILWLAFLIRRMFVPRLAYHDGTLLVFLQGARPVAVPIENVECFFRGQGPSMVPKPLEGKHGEATESANVIIRLAEAAKEWHHRDVNASLGQWCEGYITIRGTWSEPLTAEVLARLNRRLVEVHRNRRELTQQAVVA